MARPLRILLLVVALLGVAGCNHRDDTSVYGGRSTYHPHAGHTRVASYHGVQVTVPRSWTAAGLGCATAHHGHVARPAPGCPAPPASSLPSGPAVWFDSPLPTGTRRHGSLTVRTIALAGQHLTVAAPHALVGRVVDSAHRVSTDDNGCPLHAPAAGTWPDGGLGRVYAFSVCLYSRPAAELTWSAVLPADRGARFVDRLVNGRRIRGLPSRDERTLPVVVLIVKADPKFGTFPTTVRFRVQFRPGRVTGGPHLATVALDPPLRRTWATDGARTYLPEDLLR